jgi:hypothetical protein
MSARNGSSELHACGRPKREVYDWEVPGERGDFQWVSKFSLRVDHTYQRETVSQARVNEIAAGWSWPALGVLGVFRRDDGTLWIYDGQHRWLAAKKRDDVQELPCLIFTASGAKHLKLEAAGFGKANNARGSMNSIERFKADLVAECKVALAVQDLVESCGYRIAHSTSDGTVSFVRALAQAMNTDRAACEEAFLCCASIVKGATFSVTIFKGLFFLEQHLKKIGLGINTPHIREKLHSATEADLIRAMDSAIIYHGKGGERIGADGLVQFINKGKRTRHIPAIVQVT